MIRRFFRLANGVLSFLALVLAMTLVQAEETVPRDPMSGEMAWILEKTGFQGGMVVFVNWKDVGDISHLAARPDSVVHALVSSPEEVKETRGKLVQEGSSSRGSADLWDGTHLPYVDGFVNLILSRDPSAPSKDEILRCLVPGGTALLGDEEKRIADFEWITRPWPGELDDWSHGLYDGSNNAANRDRVVGPPHHLQWVAEPQNARHHESLASVTVVVSAGGRLFYVVDEAPAASILLPANWKLVARDAFNGVLLWKKDIPLWENHHRAFRSGPPELSRRLVATEKEIYVTLGFNEPVVALSAATGQLVRSYEETRFAEEILYQDGILFVVKADKPSKDHRREEPKEMSRTIMAVDVSAGMVLWSTQEVDPLPMSLAVQGSNMACASSNGVLGLDAASGRVLWDTPRVFVTERPGWSSPTLVLHDGVVLCADRKEEAPGDINPVDGRKMARWLVQEGWMGELVAYDANTGHPMWSCPCSEVYHAGVDIFVVRGVVWTGQSPSRTGPDFREGRDLKTGEVVREIFPDLAFQTTMPHHRCHRNRVAGDKIVLGRTGVEFIDLDTGEASRHHWVRGVCQFGTLPCNGLLYAPPHACACYIEGKLTGFLALAPAREGAVKTPLALENLPKYPIEQGEAYSDAPQKGSSHGEDWLTYRGGPERYGKSLTSLPMDLKQVWSASLGKRLTPPVVGEKLVLVATKDRHEILALDQATGEIEWTFLAGGSVDSPPTLSQGRVVFGCRDGTIYCLRASDGVLAWRFRPFPMDRRVMSYGQLESVWPIHGSVLVRDGVVYAAAGRSSFLDGGILLFKLDLATGRALSHRFLYTRDEGTGEQPEETGRFEMPGALPDVLSLQGGILYMRHLALDPGDLSSLEARPHLYSPSGFLNDNWWHRTYWIYGSHFYSGYIGWYFAGREVPGGRMLCVKDDRVYGYSYTPDFYRGALERRYHLFAADLGSVASQEPSDYGRASRDYPANGERKWKVPLLWQQTIPLLGRAMAVSRDCLFVAGPSEKGQEDLSVYQGNHGCVLSLISLEDGQVRGEFSLPSVPVHDGMALAKGYLYLCTEDGSILCLGQ